MEYIKKSFEYKKIKSYEPQSHPYNMGDPQIVKNPGAPVKAGYTIMRCDGFTKRCMPWDITVWMTVSYTLNPDVHALRAPSSVAPDVSGFFADCKIQ